MRFEKVHRPSQFGYIGSFGEDACNGSLVLYAAINGNTVLAYQRPSHWCTQFPVKIVWPWGGVMSTEEFR